MMNAKKLLIFMLLLWLAPYAGAMTVVGPAAPSTKAVDGKEAKKEAKAEAASVSAQAGADYCINVMWINRSLNADQRYIYPTNDLDELQCKFLCSIYGWAAANPDSFVNVWYDSVVTPAKAVANTQALIESYVGKHPELAPIKLRDVRTIPRVIEEPKVFSAEMPVYFRVDLLRVIISCYLLSSGETTCFVYADSDMNTCLSKTALFDDETQKKLEKYGIVLAEYTTGWFENGFQIISNQRKHLLEAMEWVLVELNIQRAYNALEGNFSDTSCSRARSVEASLKCLQQIVFSSYNEMFKYFYHLEGLGTLYGARRLVRGVCVYDVYDKKKHGLRPLGLATFQHPQFEFTSSFELENKLELEPFQKIDALFVPTKKVPLPAPGLQYD